jgi:hypothetical protein
MLISNFLLISSVNLASRELDEPPKTISSTYTCTIRPPMPHAPSDEEESEPETFESIWERSQQVDPATNKDYWDRAYGNSYYNPTFGGVYSARSSYSEVPFMGTQGQGTSSSMPPVDPNAQGSSRAVGGYYYGSLFGSVNPYDGMASHLPPFPPPPPLCLRVSLCHRLKMMMMKNHEQLSKTPKTFIGI